MTLSKSLRTFLIPTAAALALILPTGSGAEGQMPPENSDPLLVLSYNVCWKCMTNQAASEDGCDFQDNPTITECARNVAALIERTPRDYGATNYDFVSIQEGSNWSALVAEAPTTLGKLTAQPHREGKECAVTLYDAAKYELTHAFGGDSVDHDAYKGDGHYAFEVLIFEPNELIFVNVHNCHGDDGCNLMTLETTLSQSLRDQHLDPKKLEMLKSFRVIVAGDFNESFQDEYGGTQEELSFAPFEIVVKVKNPPDTCCLQDTPHPADFILDSASPGTPMIPKGYDPNRRQSDHLPVVAVLPPGP